MNPKALTLILQAQQKEITEYHVYSRLAKAIKNRKNRQLLIQIANDELRHYNIWKKHTGRDIKPNRIAMWKYLLISKFLGMTFGLKLMEKNEEAAQKNYQMISRYIKNDAKKIAKDEHKHELKLISMLNEKKLLYVGSIVLGLNDALVELTGALAGLTLVLQNTKLIAVVGLITGIAASLSMAASEYLSTRTESDMNKLNKADKHPVNAAIYTGIAYILTVLLLIFPYLLNLNIYVSLIWMMANAIFVIFFFSYYVSVTKDIDFKKEFWGMVFISLGVAAVSFVIGLSIREFFDIHI